MNEPDCELSAIVFLTERTTSQVSVNAPGFDLSAGPLRPSMCNSDLSVCPVPVHEFNIELSVCPTTLKEANTEFVALSVTTQKPAFEPLNPPVMSPETTNAFYYGLSVRPVTVTGPDHEQLVNPASITELSAHSVVTRETINAIIVFPASVLEDMFCLSLVSQSLLCLLHRGGFLPCLLHTGGLLLCLLRRGGQLSGSGGLLPRRGGILSCSGDLLLRPFCQLHHGPPVLPVLPQSQGLTWTWRTIPHPVPPPLHHPPGLLCMFGVSGSRNHASHSVCVFLVL